MLIASPCPLLLKGAIRRASVTLTYIPGLLSTATEDPEGSRSNAMGRGGPSAGKHPSNS